MEEELNLQNTDDDENEYTICSCTYRDYLAAQKSFSRALELDPHFPSAYYSRGVAYILGGQIEQGLSDLSQAGELGLYTAYNLIKKYSKELTSKNTKK